MNGLTSRARKLAHDNYRNPNAVVYAVLVVLALFYPLTVQFATGGSGDYLVSTAADAGVYVLLAIGLNVVVGFAGLLDLGDAALDAPSLPFWIDGPWANLDFGVSTSFLFTSSNSTAYYVLMCMLIAGC